MIIPGFAFEYILNGYGDKEWNDWLVKAQSLNVNEVIQQYNKAQKRYDAL